MTAYNFLPFNFSRNKNSVLLTNDVGKYTFITEGNFDKFVNGELEPNEDSYSDLKSNNFLYTENLPSIINLLANLYRSKRAFLFDFTSLHMVVVTRRCNQSCTYCHAGSLPELSDESNDIDENTSRNIVDKIFESPCKYLKVEFQGGEPLLAFDKIKYFISLCEQRNISAQKSIQYVICSNLTTLDDNKLEYLKNNNIYLSTSLDGPQEFHDSCRLFNNRKGTYKIVSDRIKQARSFLGNDKVSALMTTTKYNINNMKDIIDEYVKIGFDSIFIRMLNPLGSAHKNLESIGYPLVNFVSAYKMALDYIIQLNKSGIYFKEIFATILLTKILTPFCTKYVDLQSPAGVGISGVIYDINGDVFISDEARMLNRTDNDKTFCIGNVNNHSYAHIFGNNNLRKIISKTCLEAIPGCSWCTFQPYCGIDPVFNYHMQKNTSNYHQSNFLCAKNKAIFETLFDYIHNSGPQVMNIFWQWINGKSTSVEKVAVK